MTNDYIIVCCGGTIQVLKYWMVGPVCFIGLILSPMSYRVNRADGNLEGKYTYHTMHFVVFYTIM